MKKYLKIVLPLLFIAILAYFVYGIITKINYKKEVANHIKTIPAFSYQNINGKLFTQQNLKKNTPTLFAYFNTECEFCNEEATMLQQHITKFSTVQIVFVSFEKPIAIKQFAAKYKLNKYDNIHFVADTQLTFATTFDVKSMPCLVLYNKDGHLIEKIKGQTKPEILLNKLMQNK